MILKQERHGVITRTFLPRHEVRVYKLLTPRYTQLIHTYNIPIHPKENNSINEKNIFRSKPQTDMYQLVPYSQTHIKIQMPQK